MTVDESGGLRDELEELEGATTEAEHEEALEDAGAVDVPLEADEPEVERSHPGAERGEDDFA